MSFKIGDRVVCVDVSTIIPNTVVLYIKKDHAYVISGITKCDCGSIKFSLEGINQPMLFQICSNCRVPHKTRLYSSWRFRKLDDDFGAKIAERIEQTFIKPLIIAR